MSQGAQRAPRGAVPPGDEERVDGVAVEPKMVADEPRRHLPSQFRVGVVVAPRQRTEPLNEVLDRLASSRAEEVGPVLVSPRLCSFVFSPMFLLGPKFIPDRCWPAIHMLLHPWLVPALVVQESDDDAVRCVRRSFLVESG